MNYRYSIGDLVRLRSDGYGGPDYATEAAGIDPGATYRVQDLVRDRRGVVWVVLDGIRPPQRKYPGWAGFRFERVGAYDDGDQHNA